MKSLAADLLLVEDSVADAELVLASLVDLRPTARIHVAGDGIDALDYLFCRGQYLDRPSDKPRVVVLDLKLPKMSGLDVLREIRNDDRTRTLPVVMLTSSAAERDVARAYHLGVNSYVQKPVDFGEFRETVRLLGHYWLSRNQPMPANASRSDPR